MEPRCRVLTCPHADGNRRCATHNISAHLVPSGSGVSAVSASSSRCRLRICPLGLGFLNTTGASSGADIVRSRVALSSRSRHRAAALSTLPPFLLFLLRRRLPRVGVEVVNSQILKFRS